MASCRALKFRFPIPPTPVGTARLSGPRFRVAMFLPAGVEA